MSYKKNIKDALNQYTNYVLPLIDIDDFTSAYILLLDVLSRIRLSTPQIPNNSVQTYMLGLEVRLETLEQLLEEGDKEKINRCINIFIEHRLPIAKLIFGGNN